MKTLNERLKFLIERDKTLNVNKLASEIKINPNTIWAILRGQTSHPKSDLIVSLCNYFNVTSDWLLFGKEPAELASDDAAYESYVDNLKTQYFSVRKELESYQSLVSTLNERIKLLESNIEQASEKSKSAKKDNAALEISPINSDSKKGNKNASKSRTNVAQGIFTIGLNY